VGVYYNPVTDITDGIVGRRIQGHDHAAAKRQLRGDEHLYVVCDRAIFMQAANVDAKSEFDAFYQVYMTGNALSFELYALTAEQHQRADTR